MNENKDELAGLKAFLAQLSPEGGMTLRRGQKDVTARERAILEAEIAFLEKVIARNKEAS